MFVTNNGAPDGMFFWLFLFCICCCLWSTTFSLIENLCSKYKTIYWMIELFCKIYFIKEQNRGAQRLISEFEHAMYVSCPFDSKVRVRFESHFTCATCSAAWAAIVVQQSNQVFTLANFLLKCLIFIFIFRSAIEIAQKFETFI